MNVYKSIIKAIKDFNPDCDGNIWTDGHIILCDSQDKVNHIADLFDAMGYTSITGYYDPREDDFIGGADAYSGWYYVEIE